MRHDRFTVNIAPLGRLSFAIHAPDKHFQRHVGQRPSPPEAGENVVALLCERTRLFQNRPGSGGEGMAEGFLEQGAEPRQVAVANRTASGDELLDALRAKAQAEGDVHERLFIVVVPQEGGDGSAARRARTRLALVLRRLHDAGLTAAGMIGDPDPYTAIMNALQYFRVDDIVISTFAETKSGWLRADLIDRVRNATGKDVQHVVQHDPVRAA